MRMVDVQQRHEWHAIASIESGPVHAVAVWSHGAGLRMLVSATAEPRLLTEKQLHRTSGAHGPGRDGWISARTCMSAHVGVDAATCACQVC